MDVLLQIIRATDLNVYDFFNGLAGNWFLDRLASHAEANQLLRGGFFLAFYWYRWFQAGSDREKRRKAIVVILLATLLAVVFARMLAHATPFRTRPMYDLAVQHRPYSVPVIGDLENWSAFPSDTAAYFFALACGVAYMARRFTIPIMAYTAGWICLPRVYFGVHWASDIVAGAAIGIAVVWFSLRTEWLWARVTSRVLGVVDAFPQVFYAAAFIFSFELSTRLADIPGPARAVAHLVRLALRRESTGMSLIFIAILGLSAIAAWFCSGGRGRRYFRARQG
jgi:undecaprenyl-diphosphatase